MEANTHTHREREREMDGWILLNNTLAQFRPFSVLERERERQMRVSEQITDQHKIVI